MRGLAHVLLGLLLGVVAGPPAPASAESAPEPVSLVVGLRPGTAADAPVDRLEDRTTVDVVESAPVAGTGAVTVDVPREDVASAAAALRTDPAVAYVEVDHVATKSAVSVDDPYRYAQWGIDRARVDDAWADTTGAADVVVAVVDTGVKPVGDLAGKVLPGWDFVNNDSNAVDDEGHGTQVATTLGALADNGRAAAGVCWKCRIMPVKALGRDGSGSYSDIAAAITWSADHGADIINLSLGGEYDSHVLRAAVAHATGKGALVIAAAGNDGTSARHYPAAIPAVLSVGASTSTDARYGWSNFGSDWVDITAPGCNLAEGRDRRVGWFCGTSSATPFVAGVAGLLRSVVPTPTGEQIKTHLLTSAAPVGSWVGSGRVDAVAALARVPLWVSGVRAGSHVRGDVPLRVHVGTPTGGADTVRASVNGSQVGLDSAAPWSFPAHLGALDGPVTLDLVALDGGSPVATVSVPITVDHAAPTVSFAGPGPYGHVRGRVSAWASAADSVGVAGVQLLVDGRPVAVDRAAPYLLSWNSGAADRTARLTLRAYDRAGNASDVHRWVVADNTAPLVRITRGPGDGRRVAGTVRLGVAAADVRGVSRLDLLVNGELVGSHAGGSHTFAVPTDRFGRTLRVQVRAVDAAGNVRYAAARTWRS